MDIISSSSLFSEMLQKTGESFKVVWRAYSCPKRTLIPEESGQQILSKTDSDSCWKRTDRTLSSWGYQCKPLQKCCEKQHLAYF